MKKVILLALINAFCFCTLGYGAETLMFNREFIRGTGAPGYESVNFNGYSGAARLVLVNGDLVDTSVEKTSSSVIKINGDVIFGASDFNQNVTSLEKTINLAGGINVLEVWLAGKPGGNITIQVYQTPPFVPPTGVLLPGAASASAISMTYDLDMNGGVPEAEITVDAFGRRTARTEIEIMLRSTATVGDVNGLLDSIGGRIVSMIQGSPFLTLRIPDPGTLTALDELVQRVKVHPAVQYVRKGYFPAPAMLPRPYTSPPLDCVVQYLGHHLAVRAAAAWNGQEAIFAGGSPPTMIVTDFFGSGEPLWSSVFSTVPGDFRTGSLTDHGYHVLGIIGSWSVFGGAEDINIVGMYPTPIVPLRAVDVTGGNTWEAIEDKSLRLIKNSNRNAVFNTSLQYVCNNADLVLANCNAATAEEGGWIWAAKVRTLHLEESFLHVAAGGNVEVAGDTYAPWASPFNAAALLPGIRNWDGSIMSNLTNTIVVENLVAENKPPYTPVCMNLSSKRPGDLSAIGTDVWSFVSSSPIVNTLTGTSMATPQVAGLAAYVWALKPTLTPQEVIDLLKTTSSNVKLEEPLGGACDVAQPAPVIDAYDAVLGTDSWLDPKVRLAVLDVADGAGLPGKNGKFDEYDINLLLGQIMPGPDVQLSRPLVPDYSRYDLNGDGYTLPFKARRFDLDINIPPEYGDVTQYIEGDVSYCEKCITDLDVLCYYAYSDLYTGDIAARTSLLGRGICGGIGLIWKSPVIGTVSEPYRHVGKGKWEGTIFHVWASDESGQLGFWAQRMDSSGNYLENPVFVPGLVGRILNSPFHDVFVDGLGNAFVLGKGPAGEIIVTRYEQGQGWGTPEVVGVSGTYSYIVMSVNASGIAIVAWATGEGTGGPIFGGPIYSRRYLPKGYPEPGWGPVMYVKTVGLSDWEKLISIDNDGNANLITYEKEYDYTGNPTDYAKIFATRYISDKGWGVPDLLWDLGHYARQYYHNIAYKIDDCGNGILLFSYPDSSLNEQALSLRFDRDKGWDKTPSKVGRGSFQSFSMGGNGNALTIVRDNSEYPYLNKLVQYEPSRGWFNEAIISNNSECWQEYYIDMNRSGSAVIKKNSSTFCDVQGISAMFFKPGIGLTPSVNYTGERYGSSPFILLDNKGKAFTIDSDEDGLIYGSILE